MRLFALLSSRLGLSILVLLHLILIGLFVCLLKLLARLPFFVSLLLRSLATLGHLVRLGLLFNFVFGRLGLLVRLGTLASILANTLTSISLTIFLLLGGSLLGCSAKCLLLSPLGLSLLGLLLTELSL